MEAKIVNVTPFVRKRALQLGLCMINEIDMTVRKLAEIFDIPSSTVHRNLLSLQYVDPEMYGKVAEVMKRNKLERSSRGGKKPYVRKVT